MEEKFYQRQLEAALEASKRDSLSEAVTEDSEELSHDELQSCKPALASKATTKPRNSNGGNDDNKENRSSSEAEEKPVNKDYYSGERLHDSGCHSSAVAEKESANDSHDNKLDSEEAEVESKSNGKKGDFRHGNPIFTINSIFSPLILIFY